MLGLGYSLAPISNDVARTMRRRRQMAELMARILAAVGEDPLPDQDGI